MTILATPIISTPIAAPRTRRVDPPAMTEELLRARGRLDPGHPDRAALRARAIEESLPLAHRLARRYARRGERYDDLAQVAALALVKAVDRYDLDRSSPFVNYAIPTIVGAIKRHFRDTTWGMRVPRPIQQLVLELPRASSVLEQLHGRPPTSVELAEHLRVDVVELLEAVGASQVYRLASVNASHPDSDAELIDLIGGADPSYDGVEDRLLLRPLLAALSLRERRILGMRFYGEMTQARIAAEIGISQMHVSRLLQRSLTQLRAGLSESVDAADADGGVVDGTKATGRKSPCTTTPRPAPSIRRP